MPTIKGKQLGNGVSIKFWSVLLQDDGLEENNEVFKVILNKPKNAVLGHKRELAVEILDPRAGGCDSSATFQTDNTQEVLERARKGSESPLHAGHSLMASGRGNIPHEEHLFNKDDHRHLHGFSSRGDVPQTEHLLDHVNVDFHVFADTKPKKKKLAAEHRQLNQGIVPTGSEGQLVLPLDIRAAAQELLSVLPIHLQSRHDFPQGDLGVKNEPISLQTSTKQRPKSRSCPPGWVLRDKHCYMLSSAENATWESAERDCQRRSSGHLASVHSTREMAWLWKFANKQPFWIGLKEEGKMDHWVWSNGRPVTFRNFKERKATLSKTAERKCAFVQMQKKWVARPCSQREKGRYICSVPSLTDATPRI